MLQFIRQIKIMGIRLGSCLTNRPLKSSLLSPLSFLGAAFYYFTQVNL